TEPPLKTYLQICYNLSYSSVQPHANANSCRTIDTLLRSVTHSSEGIGSASKNGTKCFFANSSTGFFCTCTEEAATEKMSPTNAATAPTIGTKEQVIPTKSNTKETPSNKND